MLENRLNSFRSYFGFVFIKKVSLVPFNALPLEVDVLQ